jgi:PAS domain S-box-containing protein
MSDSDRSSNDELPSLSYAEAVERLREAEETLDAIRSGEVDAVVIGSANGQQVYTLENADRPYRVLVEQMQEGAVTLSDDATVLYCNERFARLIDVEREDVIGRPITTFFRLPEFEIIRDILARGVGTGFSAEFTLVGSAASQVPVNVSLIDLRVDEGMPRMVCGIITDLTVNRKRSQELEAANTRLAGEIIKREKTEENLQLALDAADMGTWDLDLSTNLARRSLRHDQIFGHDEALETFGLMDALEQFISEDRHLVTEAFDQAKVTGRIEFVHRIKRLGDGAIRWVHVKGRTYYEGNTPSRIAGVIADVTERRETEDQLRQAQKMEAVGQLTGGIAHDFNNLLMVIGGSLDMLVRRMPDDEKVQRLFESARQGVARGAKLNQQLLAFSRRQDLQFEVVHIDELVPTFEDLLDRALGETIALKISLVPNLWSCRTDPHQLETAILNLAINARDAMPNGGELILSAENRFIDEAESHRWGALPGEYVQFAVSDVGEGIAPDIVGRIFEPFFTTKDVGKGTGLGLSQVYGFAKQSNGFVSIVSELGRGTTVEINLPRARGVKKEARDIATVVAEIGSGVILVVEDDPQVRMTTCGLLEDLGYSVISADSGRVALSILDDGTPIDLVFTDVIMPDGMSGIELMRQIGMRRPSLPILLTSGYTAQRIIPESLAGELKLLRKPYNQKSLLNAIQGAMFNIEQISPP